MMSERLKLAKTLLSDRGVIFISIDDREQAYLKVLCDEIFGEGNFLGCIVQNKGNAQNDAKNIQKNHDYHIVYCKRRKFVVEAGKEKEVNLIFSNSVKLDKSKQVDGQGYIFKQKLDAPTKHPKLKQRPNLGYVVYWNEITGDLIPQYDYDKELAKTSDDIDQVYKFDNSLIKKGYKPIIPTKFKNELGRWRWTLETFIADKANIIVYNGRLQIVEKSDTDVERHIEQPLKSFVDFSTSVGTTALSDILNNDAFDNPKNPEMLKYFIASMPNKDSIILDFFAGSGTTGQAVMELNEEDGGNRRCILVTNNENNIAYNVTRERLTRVINGKGSKDEPIKWQYSKDNRSLTNNQVRVFEIKHYQLTLQDLEKCEELTQEALASFKKLNYKYKQCGEFDIYNELSSLNPYKKEKGFRWYTYETKRI